MTPTPLPPRLLLLEDDPVSTCFLRDALSALPARVVAVSTLAAAEIEAQAASPAWAFDANLPDGHAAVLLPRLRARGLTTPALALSASVDADVRRRLRAAGFAQVLGKPIPADVLRAAVRALLPSTAMPVWDDAAALAALGDAASVAALRTLFVTELPAQYRCVQAACAAGDHARAREVLHRMTSGCGFVGATALGHAVRAVAADPGDAAALARFTDCAEAITA